MFKPLALFIGLRYIRAKSRNRFVSLISFVSVFGIALGVGVLITVLSVMNGFDQQIRDRIFTMVPHITVTGMNGTITNWQKTETLLQKIPGVLGVAPAITREGMLAKSDTVRAVMIVGIDPERENHISELSQKMVLGKLSYLKSTHFGIVLGQELAVALGVSVGDHVRLITPQVSTTPLGLMPRIKAFTVVGVFRVGTGFGFDSGVAFINLKNAESLFMIPQAITELEIKTSDLMEAPALAIKIQKILGFQYQVSDWSERYGAFYHAVRMEKNIIFLILLLLIAIAAFNLIASLVMQVHDKKAEIAILRTFGATPKTIMLIFIVQGTMLGIVGTIFGVIGGMLLAHYVTPIVEWIQNMFHVELLTSGVYFVDYLPSQLLFSDVLHISIASLSMSFLATIYPAWRAARTWPVEALRYE